MEKVTITCPKCKKKETVTYRTTFGHALADEAIAIEYAIRKHICKVPVS